MFTFLYFWYFLVISLNVIDFIRWLCAITPANRRTFVHKRLHSKRYFLQDENVEGENIIKFSDDYLEADGYFILSFIKENSSDYVAAEIVHRLYTEKFLPRQNQDSFNHYDDIDTVLRWKKRDHLCSRIC